MHEAYYYLNIPHDFEEDRISRWQEHILSKDWKIWSLIFAPTGKNSLEEMKQNLVSYLPLRHRYANASHAAGIPLSNIEAAMDHTTEVNHQSYARYIPDDTADLYAKRNARGA